jgi:hypothetical protein
MSLTITPMDCHLGCREITGGAHATKVVVLDDGTLSIDCDTCGSCVSLSKDAGHAIEIAKDHAVRGERR